MPRYILHNNLQEGVQYKQQVPPPSINTNIITYCHPPPPRCTYASIQLLLLAVQGISPGRILGH